MSKELFYFIVFIAWGILINYFIFLSNQNLKEEYNGKNRPCGISGLITSKKYYTSKGWKYRKLSFLLTFIFFLLVFLVFPILND